VVIYIEFFIYKNENYKYESFIPEEAKKASFVFCSTFEKEIKYSYRVGH
jgi:hypothetical protein